MIGCFKQERVRLLAEKSYAGCAGWHYIKQGCEATCIYVTV